MINEKLNVEITYKSCSKTVIQLKSHKLCIKITKRSDRITFALGQLIYVKFIFLNPN